MNTEHLSESELLKSKTWRKWQMAFGRCTQCHDMTSVLAPCCGPVEFEGALVSDGDLWDDIEKELQEAAEIQNESLIDEEAKGN